MAISRRLEKLEAKQRAAHAAWLRSLSDDAFIAYYRDLERREPELMAHVQALTDGQLQEIAGV